MAFFNFKQQQDKIIVDFVGANVAKKLHAGHMRNLNIGESLRRILKLKYPNLIADNHWGDWGVNIGVLIWGWKMEGKMENYRQNPIDELSRVYVWSNNQKGVVENWEKLVRDEFVKLEQKDEKNWKLWQDFIMTTKNNLKLDLELMNVPPLELEQGESFYENDVRILWDFLEKFGIWQSEGLSRFFDFEKMAEDLAKTLENSNLAENLADLDNEQEMVGNPKNEKASISKEEKQKKQQQIQEIKKLKALGRCYLVSSAGYTSYAFRDVAARIQWTRDLDAKTMITITGNEQIHHFQQVFAICEYLSNLKEFQDFFGNTVFENLKKENLVHIPYGFLTLSDGKMSSRSGNVLTIRDFFDQVQQTALENLVAKNQQKNQKEDNTLENEEEKFEISTKESNLENFENSKDLANTEGDLVWKSQKIALAALKWYDLNRSASENLVLNIPEILNFVGNTGVYQLYTFARIKNILKKCQADNSQILEIENNSLNNDFDSNFDGNSKKTNPENNDKINFTADFNLLNTEEKIILKKLYLTDFVLEKICQNFKPHLLCTHLYELCTLINAWYGNNSVSGETDPIRQQTLLVLCTKITIYLRESLNLLGIEVLDDL